MTTKLGKPTLRILVTQLVGLFLIFIVCGCSNPEISITISQEEIQQRIAPRFPFEKNLMIAQFTLHTPQAYLLDSKVGLKLKFNAKLLRHQLDGDLNVKGTVRYNNDTGQFFVEQLEVVGLEVSDKSFSNNEQLQSIILPVLKSHLKDKPVYTLPDETIKQQLTGKLLKSVVVKDSSFVVTFAR